MIDETHTYDTLPTGKQHISFSEIKDWHECSFRHKLKYISKIDLGKPGPLMDFGTAVHAACENYLRTRTMDPKIASAVIKTTWEKNKTVPGYESETIDGFVTESNNILNDVPEWLEKTFPAWQFIDAEHGLYEPIEGHAHAFKGFIDGIILCKGPRNKDRMWLIDWKTTSYGWNGYKRRDAMVMMQLVLYKNFWAKKTMTDPKDIRCGFILLKRSAKTGNHCELITSSAGSVTTTRSLKVINNMLSCVKRGIAVKNRSSCTYCDYNHTKHCP